MVASWPSTAGMPSASQMVGVVIPPTRFHRKGGGDGGKRGHPPQFAAFRQHEGMRLAQAGIGGANRSLTAAQLRGGLSHGRGLAGGHNLPVSVQTQGVVEIRRSGADSILSSKLGASYRPEILP